MTFVMGCFTAVSALFVFAVFLEIVFGFLKNESFDTIVGYVLVTIGLFALFFAIAMIFGAVEVFGK